MALNHWNFRKRSLYIHIHHELQLHSTQIARFLWPTWSPPGPCRPQVGPMLAAWTLLSGYWSSTVGAVTTRPKVLSNFKYVVTTLPSNYDLGFEFVYLKTYSRLCLTISALHICIIYNFRLANVIGRISDFKITELTHSVYWRKLQHRTVFGIPFHVSHGHS